MILEVEKLQREYLPETTFALERGQCLALVGANGAGKTTLIKTLIGLLNHSGKINLEGKSLNLYTKKDLASLLAYVPQVLDSDCNLSVLHFLQLSFYAKSRIDNQRLDQAVKIFKLEKLISKNMNSLSGGERQKVFIASAFCQDPKIYFLDEPFSALDKHATEELISILDKIKKSGSSIVITLHDVELILKCADQILHVGSDSFN